MEAPRRHGQPPPVLVGTAAESADGAARRPHTTLVVVPRTVEIQAAEDGLDLALVALVGGCRPPASMAMVSRYLLDRFGITLDEADVQLHEPEDFVVGFHHHADRDRVLASRPGGALLPLIWRPRLRTTLAIAGAFRFQVLVALSRVPLHARNSTVAQTILGPSCTEVELVRMRDVPDDDDREMFAKAWCWHPHFIRPEQLVFIPEP